MNYITTGVRGGNDLIIKYFTDSNGILKTRLYVNDILKTEVSSNLNISGKTLETILFRILGDHGNGYQAVERIWSGEIYYKDTYIKDLDTGEYVVELVDGINK